MELEISPRVSILLLSDGSKSVSSTCATSWNEFISTCWGCQNFSGEMAVLILLLWTKCHVFLCICPPGVSSLSLATGYFLQLYCCLQPLLFIIGIPTVVSYKMVTAPGFPDDASLLPSHTSYFFPTDLLVAMTLTWIPGKHSRAGTLVFSFQLNKMWASNKSCYNGTTPLLTALGTDQNWHPFLCIL